MQTVKGASGKNGLGFTLIELLIVVAIIAILAAIAVPNFLEAQTRSKVSRVKADLRTAATAIESYAVDWNRPPPGVQELSINLNDPRSGAVLRGVVWTRLTTPIAYVTSMIYDPFVEKGNQDNRLNFTYQTFVILTGGSGPRQAAYKGSYLFGYTWGISSWGPWRASEVVAGPNGMPYILATTNSEGGPGGFVYDPTNGTVSAGMLIRTNKGIYIGPGS